jgi:hypothetical protein
MRSEMDYRKPSRRYHNWTPDTDRDERRPVNDSALLCEPHRQSHPQRLTEFAPVLLLQLHLVFLRGGFDAFPSGVPFRVGRALHLLETGDCIAYVSSVMDRLLTLLSTSILRF